MKKIISTISTDSKGVHTMKKTLMVLALATVLVFSFATVASAKYASYSATSAYLSWGGANTIAGADQVTPHGGYTQSTVKCAVCHSTHRAYSAARVDTGKTDTKGNVIYAGGAESTAIGLGYDNNLLAGSNACAACHASWGANSSGNTLVEMGQTTSGPHMGNANNCYDKKCHGSIHGSQTSTYAAVAKYNLSYGGTVADLDAKLDEAIAAGNVAQDISTTAAGRSMKAYVTGYTCAACHGASSFAIAAAGYTNQVTDVANMISEPGTDTVDAVSFRTGHPSIGNDTWGYYVPTCETCHDMIGVASNSTAWPNANRGIDVFKGRYDEEFGGVNGKPGAASVSATQKATDNTDATRYGLWMTSGAAIDDGSAHGERAMADAEPIAGVSTLGYNLRDGACMKCHIPTKLP